MIGKKTCWTEDHPYSRECHGSQACWRMTGASTEHCHRPTSSRRRSSRRTCWSCRIASGSDGGPAAARASGPAPVRIGARPAAIDRIATALTTYLREEQAILAAATEPEDAIDHLLH